jgi:hypothetical protein
VADALRIAHKPCADAQHLEDTDTPAEDILDFLTGRDFTPWS